MPYSLSGGPYTPGHVFTVQGDGVSWDFAAPAGGSDPWTNVVLGADVVRNTTAGGAVTGLAFTPAANKRYLVEAFLLLRASNATVGARPGYSAPTGDVEHAGRVEAPNSLVSPATRYSSDGVVGFALSTGLPNNSTSWFGKVEAIIITGAAPSGDFQVTLASEADGVDVTARAGSFLRYRAIA